MIQDNLSTNQRSAEEFIVNSLQDLGKIAQEVKNRIKKPSIVLLQGNLGAGKTAFVKKFVEQYDYPARKVKSPTFTIINNYYIGQEMTINHLDLYRINQLDLSLLNEILDLTTNNNSHTFIEWPELLENRAFKGMNQYLIQFEITELPQRKIKFQQI